MYTDSYKAYIKYYIRHIFVLVLAVILSSAVVLSSHAEEQKLHPLESYTVKYKIEGNTNGEKTQYSKDWGRTLCWKEVSESNMPGVGTVKKNEKVVTTITDGEQWIYTVNLNDNTGTKMKNPLFAEIYSGIKGKDPKMFSEEFMTKMGGKVVGEKVVGGEKCKIWNITGGAKACITEDLITVESSVDMAGISVKETAVEVKRNSPEPDGICDLGDAKIVEMDIKEMMQK
jgi:hypothetical protein